MRLDDTETALSPPPGTEADDWPTPMLKLLRSQLSEWGQNAFDNYAELAQDATSENARTFWRQRAELVTHEPPF